MKYYHMIIEKELPWGIGDAKATRREYISTHQGDHPIGWRVVGVCGYHDEPPKRQNAKNKNYTED